LIRFVSNNWNSIHDVPKHADTRDREEFQNQMSLAHAGSDRDRKEFQVEGDIIKFLGEGIEHLIAQVRLSRT
jgi:hypothetical protein